MKQAKKYIITSALPYVNEIKHLGTLVGSLLPADVYARFLRQSGRETLFICATDEHGTPAEISALRDGEDVATYCNKLHEMQKSNYAAWGLSFDHFGRTSSPQNKELTQHIAQKLEENGFTEIRTIRQIYSKTDERFLPDRYVTGTCPSCGYDKARGDQCENCGREMDPEDLVNPRSSVSGSTDLELRETKHLFHLLSKMGDKLERWFEGQTEWPPLVKSIAYKWLHEGLRDRCITRDLKWGIPCNIKGLEDKVFYVWFDAPIGYISATKEWADKDPANRDWKSYWYDVDDSVCSIEFMGKDNINFHTINFPAALLGTGEPWKKVDFLKGFNYLNYYGGKFSTSQHHGVFVNDAIEILPPDYWRYYLMARAPEGADSSFTWDDFQGMVNKDLCGVIGNSVNRVVRFTANNFDGKIPAAGVRGEVEVKYAAQFDEALKRYNDAFEGVQCRKASEALRAMWVTVNEYLAEGAPWTALKTDKALAASRVNFAFNMIFALVWLSRPIMPFMSEKLAKAFKIEQGPTWHTSAAEALSFIKEERSFEDPGLLFRRLEDDELVALKERFGEDKM